MTTTAKRISGTLHDQLNVSLYVSDCARCGVIFGMTTEFEGRRRYDAEDFYCPNGHVMTFGKSEAARLRDKLEAEQRVSEQARRNAQWEREARKHAEAQARGYKGAMAKTKKRVAAGVCPACNRSFAALQRHMASQHPEFGS